MYREFSYLFGTGSGTTKVKLLFQDDLKFNLNFYSNWMGSKKVNTNLSGDYKKVADNYIVLIVNNFRFNDSEFDISEILGEKMIFEFILINQENKIKQEMRSDFTLMSNHGYATWNEFFNGILYSCEIDYYIDKIDFEISQISESQREGTSDNSINQNFLNFPLQIFKDVIGSLDKIKFEEINR